MDTPVNGKGTQSPEEVLQDYLRDNGMLMTPQRKTLLHLFLEEPKHFSAEEFYERVKQVDESIGQATVYRTLKLFTETGLAETLDFGDGRTRYERRWGREHHDHLICIRCRDSIEIRVPEIERLQEEVAARHGYKLTDHALYLYGVCPKCRGKET